MLFVDVCCFVVCVCFFPLLFVLERPPLFGGQQGHASKKNPFSGGGCGLVVCVLHVRFAAIPPMTDGDVR
jgi:hypothetical protein